MANEFVARKGLISSGSINVSGSVTASYFKGDGSQLSNTPTSSTVISVDTYTFNGTGTTTAYVLSQSYSANSLIISVDGLVQTNVIDFALSSSTLTFVDTPPSASNILVRALLAATTGVTGSFTGSFIGDGHGLTNINAAISIDTYTFNGTGATTAYVLSQSYSANSLVVSVAGLSQTNITDYTVSTNTLTFVNAPPSASNILIRAFVDVSSNATGSFSGSFIGTATSASYAISASAATSITFAPASASYATTASAATSITFTPTTASFSTTASAATSITFAPASASYATTASAATSITFAPASASYATTASAATSITFAPASASYATTASYAQNYAVGKAIAFSLIF